MRLRPRLSVPRLFFVAVVLAASWRCHAGEGAATSVDVFSAEQRDHWAYQPIRRLAVPAVDPAAAAGNVIDAFVLRRLADAKIPPAREANRRTLIRRVTIDLLGVPPSPDEIAAFLADARPDAYERLVDRLLASPRLGERWARHWLDLVRYAESDGYKTDAYRPGAWRYRDYVIRAFNGDTPYDRFVMEQLAGDEIWPDDANALVATGFLRHWPLEDNGRDLDRAWAEVLDDVTEVTAQVFLGLTMGCARCHDHKFDAILQRDYYALQAFFAAMVPRDDFPVGGVTAIREYRRQLEEWRSATRKLREARDGLRSPYHQKAQKERGKRFPPVVQAILDRPAENRTLYERQLIHIAGEQLRVESKKMLARMEPRVRRRWDELEARIARQEHLRPKSLPFARGVRDIAATAPPITIPDKEDAGAIAPAFPAVLGSRPVALVPPASHAGTTGRRTALARWIVEGDNPLAARVIVNRVWQHHFTRGLVATPGDFGVKGDRPSHPELLDWLSFELGRSGWSLKRLHRLILTSRAYRRVAVADPAATGFDGDPGNRLLWRMNGRRVEAEVVRDSILATSGELDLRMGGESVFPVLPKGLTARYGWKASADVLARARRSVYLAVKRNMSLPLLKTFDVPDNIHTCARRSETTTPTQALVLLNEAWVLARARAFAGRLLEEVGERPAALVRGAFEIALGREPGEEELAIGERFLRNQSTLVAGRIAGNEPVYAPATSRKIDPALGAALVDYCHALWNTNEFIHVD